MQKNVLPIGIFDSGVGGVSVLRELVSLMPNENYIYLADSKNAPYGTKTHEEILHYAMDCAGYLIEKGIKALVVACNTATSVCIEPLREKYPDMCIVGIEPALKPALEDDKNKRVAVMATPLTLKTGKFARLLQKYVPCSQIIALPCPGLMELVEEGLSDSREAYEYLERLFKGVPIPDAIVLGCTHYPFLQGSIKRLFPNVRIYDGGSGVARQLKKLLAEKNLDTLSLGEGQIVFENTLGDAQKNLLAEKLCRS